MHQILFVVFSLLVLSVHSWEYNVTVDQTLNMTNDCIQDSNNTFLCATINSALRNLKHDSTVIYIRPGNYTLRNGEETDITHKQDIAIIGSGEDSVITCIEYTGLGVLYSVNITIESIVMKSCGVKNQVSVTYFTRNNKSVKLTVNVYVALYFRENYNISLDSVVIQKSKEIGLYIGDNGYNDFPSDFIMNNCSIVDGSVAESSQNSIAGGIVINTHYSTGILLSNSSIINNGDGTQSYDVYCSHIGAVAGIVVIESSPKLIIDSCVITNNTRGLVVYDQSADIQITNTTLFNHIDSVVVLKDMWANVEISLNEVTVHTFTIIVPISFPLLSWHSTIDGYFVGNAEDFTMIIGHDCNYSLQLVEKDINKCYSQQGICSGEDYSGNCPPSYSQCVDNYCPCSNIRNGTLCGQCADGYSVAINSPYMSCVPCNSSSTVYKGWALLIGLEFIPITVMVAIIAVLNVNLNQGSLSGYIFLCQMITIPFPSVSYPSWLVSGTALYDFYQYLFSLLPLSIWNIGFIYYPSYFFSYLIFLDIPLHNPLSICISHSTTPLAYLILWYAISFYPLVLALLTYCVIVMYNKGYKYVVCVVRPIHRLLARFWRLFDIQPSLSHTIASLYTLCFTQLAATSLKILHPTVYTDAESQNHTVFFYDGSQSYFSGVHGFAGTIAILLLVGLFITVAYLLLHPFKLFQKCFGKMKFKKDLIISVTDVFNGPFKDGTTENSWDYRYFAGMHFAIQLVIMTFYYIPLKLTQLTGSLKVTVCSFYLLAILIFRPYKRNIHNFSEVLLFVLLTVLSVYPALVDLDNWLAFIFFLVIMPIFGFIIIVIVIPYCIIWMIRKCSHCCKYVKGNSPNHNDIPMEDYEELITNYVHSEDNEESFVFPDRLENPKKYNVIIKQDSEISM